MKRLITSLMVLFFLIGIGTKSYGQAAGDYVFTQATDTLWATTGNWSTSDGAGNLTVATRTPTATDNVWIPATKRMGTIIAKTSASGVTLTKGSTTATLSAASTSITVGMAVKLTSAVISGVSISTIIGLTPGTYVTAINGTAVTLSQPALTSGSTVALDFYPACKNLNVSGLFRASSQFAAFGDITVNTGGILTQGSDLFCANINNAGTFNATAGYRSPKNLYIGYIGTAPGAGDYSIINDGVFGDPKITFPATSTNTSFGGIIVTYSNRANSMTIRSSSAVANYSFNVAQIQPTGYILTTANTSLNIKETMSLLGKSGLELSVQNNDSSLNTVRTCNIDPNVSVYIGGNFHANRSVTSNPQGSFVYNVFGTLDLGTYASYSNDPTVSSAINTTDFGLCLTSVAGNTGSLTFNLGDGSQANPGTLILGSYVQLMKQRTQTIAVNFKDYSTVQVTGNYGYQMNYQLLNSNVPALYLFPKNFYNLTFNGTKSILPVAPVVKGTKTYTSGAYGTTNWVPAIVAVTTPPTATTIATSLYGSASTSLLPQGSIVYTGTSYYYVPIVRATSTYLSSNPITLVGDTILNFIQPAQGVAGNNLSATVTSLTGNSLTMSSAPGATVTQTNVFVVFTGIQGTTAPTGTSTNTFSPVFDGTQGLIYLGGLEFAAAAQITAVNVPNTDKVFVYSNERNQLVIANANAGDIASVYSVSGVKIASAKLTSDNTTLSIPSGIYLVKINASVLKVIVR